MPLTISQITAASFPAILADQRKPTNNWAANPALRFLEKAGLTY